VAEVLSEGLIGCCPPPYLGPKLYNLNYLGPVQFGDRSGLESGLYRNILISGVGTRRACGTVSFLKDLAGLPVSRKPPVI